MNTRRFWLTGRVAKTFVDVCKFVFPSRRTSAITTLIVRNETRNNALSPTPQPGPWAVRRSGVTACSTGRRHEGDSRRDVMYAYTQRGECQAKTSLRVHGKRRLGSRVCRLRHRRRSISVVVTASLGSRPPDDVLADRTFFGTEEDYGYNNNNDNTRVYVG